MRDKVRFDIQLLLPGLPDEHDACADRLSELIVANQGIEKAHVRDGEFCIHFDTSKISFDKVRSLVTTAGAELGSRYGHLLLKSSPMYARHARTIRGRMAAIRGVVDVGVAVDGIIRIEFDKRIADESAVLFAISGLGIAVERLPAKHVPAAVEEEPKSVQAEAEKHDHKHGGVFGANTELIFAILCGVLLLVGWILSITTDLSPGVLLPIYLASYFFGGYYTVIESIQKLRIKQLEIDFLMLFAAVGAAVLGNWAEGALLLFLFSLSHSLEHYAMGRARRAIEALSELVPETAIVRRNGTTQSVHVDDLIVGDVVIVKPNERIAVDGFVIKGESSVDQSPITGESVPVDKRAVDDVDAAVEAIRKLPAEHRVFAGTINQSGALEVQVTRPATESMLARVVTMVHEAETQQSKTQRFAENFERVFVPIVLASVVALLFAWVVVNEPFSASFYRAMAVLVAASPCALAISTPSAVLSGVARAARGGVLIKGGAPLEDLGRVVAIAFDKTGTLTQGRPRLTDIVPTENSTRAELLETAIAAESLSDHPLAAAIVRDGKEALGLASGQDLPHAENLQSITGRGLSADIDGQKVYIGKRHLFTEVAGAPLPSSIVEATDRLEHTGRTTMIVRLGDQYLGVLGVMDTPRESAKTTVTQLRELGIDRMIMLSGDNQIVANAVAQEVGIDEAWGDLMPVDKVDSIKRLRGEGDVAMIGDGVNDAPAMAHATVGVAMGAAGSDVALETADVALMADSLSNLPFAIGLSRATNRIIKQNLWISLGMVAMLVPATLLGLSIGPAVVLHEGSTIVVVLNALRLLAFKKP
ncbi:putative cadmium-transporting ATPase [Novipirellula galeiformis]|uniref:P-type Zn(2+) transporter n=1 Tax=Novipirellula galeiformis TaxID=2528004 RepID=A0A5C6CKY7_9BACT|nr:heavy metal translocating P-type ATPase [Novipirellula galeiformis]TWU25108.1 putative cadmium-transporting ATPase [Novipirellula galeiformis]